MSVLLETTGCIAYKTFDLMVNTIPAPPTGNTLQYYVLGETLADIELTGSNIVWFSQ